MHLGKPALFVLILPLLVPALVAGPVFPVEASATFGGGIFGTWDFTFTGPAGLYLQQIAIDLGPANLGFDTVPGGFGSLASLDVGGYQGTDATTGLNQIVPGTGLTRDGGQSLIFQFNDFTAGETFHFTADVDNPNPTLAALRNCNGLGFIARGICLLQNAATTVANDALLAGASVVTAPEFAGSRVTYTFGGPRYYTSEITAAFSPDGGIRVFGSSAGVLDEVEGVPEPATALLLAAGLLFVGLRLRRRCD